MEKARDRFGIQFCIPSTDRWADRSGQQKLRRSIEKSGDGDSQQLGSDFAVGRVCIQRFCESKYREEPISNFVWDTAERSV
jgi:hypothetical protein